jgi:hypothetical protein
MARASAAAEKDAPQVDAEPEQVLFPELVTSTNDAAVARRAQVASLAKARRKVESRLARESRVFAQRLVRDLHYRNRLKQQLRDGSLHPSIEKMLWEYAYGKPRKHEVLTVEGAGDRPINVIKRIVVRPTRVDRD